MYNFWNAISSSIMSFKATKPPSTKFIDAFGVTASEITEAIKPWTPHGIRVASACWALEFGESPEAIRALGNWSSDQIASFYALADFRNVP